MRIPQEVCSHKINKCRCEAQSALCSKHVFCQTPRQSHGTLPLPGTVRAALWEHDWTALSIRDQSRLLLNTLWDLKLKSLRVNPTAMVRKREVRLSVQNFNRQNSDCKHATAQILECLSIWTGRENSFSCVGFFNSPFPLQATSCDTTDDAAV